MHLLAMNRRISTRASSHFEEGLALASFVVFVISQLLFRYSTLPATYPLIGEVGLLDVCEALAISLAICAISMRPRKIGRLKLAIAALALALLSISASLTGDWRLAQALLILFAIAGQDFNRLCRAYYMAVLPVFCVIILLSLVGLEFNKDVIPNSRLVFSYGFGHPNSAGGILFSALGAMTYACWDRRSWIAVTLLAVAAAGFSYVFLSSYASSVLLTLLVIINVAGHIPRVRQLSVTPDTVAFIASVALPLLFMTIMLFCAAFYSADNALLSWIDDIIHRRPYFSHKYYLANDGFTLFGREYSVETNYYHSGLPFSNLDSGYSYLALVYGLFPAAAIAVLYALSMWEARWDRKYHVLVAIMLLDSLFLLVEPIPLFLAASFPLLFLTQALAEDTLPVSAHAFFSEMMIVQDLVHDSMRHWYTVPQLAGTCQRGARERSEGR